MGEQTSSISAKNSCVLVRDASLLNGWKAPIYRWLKREGFSCWHDRGACRGIDWLYINLYSMIYAPGLPGVPVTSVFCDHAVTIAEFRTVWRIYKKYRGLSVLDFSPADEQARQRVIERADAQADADWKSMTFEKYWDTLRSLLAGRYGPRFDLTTAEQYMKTEEPYIRERFAARSAPAGVAEALDLMY